MNNSRYFQFLTEDDKRKLLLQKAKKMNLKHLSHGVWEDPSGTKYKETGDKFVKVADKEAEDVTGGTEQDNAERDIRLANANVPFEKLPPEQQAVHKEVAQAVLDTEKVIKREKNTKPKNYREIDGKNVTVYKDNQAKSELWRAKNPTTPEDIIEKNKKFKTGTGKPVDINVPGEPYVPKFIPSGKYPMKYVDVITAMMNTKIADKTNTQPSINYFVDGGGKGKIQAQAGEILTMAAVTMNDKDFNKFYKELADHIGDREEKGKYVINKSWLKAMKEQRSAIHKSIRERYDVDDASEIITGSCWDIKDEVETMGMKDYEKNKGNSTDIYIKVKDKYGKEYFDQWSLKKDFKVFLLNSGAGMLSKWDPDIPDDAKQEVYGKKQKEMLKGIVTENINKEDVIKYFTANQGLPEVKEVNKLLADSGLEIEDVFDGSNKNKARALKYMHEAIAKNSNAPGYENSVKILEDLRTHEETTVNAMIREMVRPGKVKDKMLGMIREKLPLKDMMSDIEHMALGKTVADKTVLSEIFGTDKWDKVEENLKAYDGPPPFVGYQAKAGSEIIEIAKINLRDEAPGYSGIIKLEMILHPKFAKLLNKTNIELLGESINFRMWFLNRDDYVLQKYRIRN